MDSAALATLHGKMDRLNDGIDAVKEKQEEMSEHVSKIKEAVYNPDSGLYARLRELESWKETSTRIIWMVVSAVVALSVATIYKSLL